MTQIKTLFIDRDGTILVEPADQQTDSIEKLDFMPGVFMALSQLQDAGYHLVIVTNQDGLGSAQFPLEAFNQPHDLMLKIFASQGIHFDAVRICPHIAEQKCTCRKPAVGLVLDYLQNQTIDRARSYVIGDRHSDQQLAENLGLGSFIIGSEQTPGWPSVVDAILKQPRIGNISRATKETQILVRVDLDNPGSNEIHTGIAFFDHMLAQLASHGGFGLVTKVSGDLAVDDHHTVEDTALSIGQAIKQALGDKRGIGRYGFVLPMDEALAQVALDLCDRPHFEFQGAFPRDKVGELSTECVPHFFRSFAQSLGAAMHIAVTGENTHHMVESVFKAVGRSLRQAISIEDIQIPSTKGVL
jgi:imidazoleglycerol-phosphate dehydratase/histidinol-phosphatase